MCRPFIFLALGLLLVSCVSVVENGGVQEPPSIIDDMRNEAPRYLTGEQLRIWSAVDTTDEFHREAVACLRRFFDQKMTSDGPSDYWLASDFDLYGMPYHDLIYNEYDSEADPIYIPTVMALRTLTKDREALMTVKWAAKDSTGSYADLRYVFDFLVKATEDGPRLARPNDHLIKEWTRRRVGLVDYVVSPLHAFSNEDALEQQSDIQRLSAFFDIPPFPITYYSYADPSDLFRAQGFQYHPLMYVHESGGMVDHGHNVHSGNDRDIYTHEIVHLYTQRAFGDRAALLDEGIATILGGSTEHPYAWHRENMARYMAGDSTIDLSDRCTTTVQDYINEHTSVPYMVGALLCEHVYTVGGKEGLLSVLGSGEEMWTALEAYGVTRDDLTDIVRARLAGPIPVIMP